MQIKYALEQALIAAEIQFLYGSYPAFLLRDDARQIAGAVLVNRSGFQAVRARAVIDATAHAGAARLSKAQFRLFSAGSYSFERRVIVSGAEDTADTAPIGEDGFRVIKEDLELEMADASPASYARAEVDARLRAWNPDQGFAADRLFLLPPDTLESSVPVERWNGPEAFALDCLRCEENLYLLSAHADVGASVAAELMEPCAFMAVGERLGRHLTTRVSEASGGIHLDQSAAAIDGCDIRRRDRYFRYSDSETLELDLNRVPHFGDFDVVVAGGGTGGAPAGISAARTGARTLILEYLSGLGGVGTEGRIARYWHGNRCGFTSEIDRGVAAMGPDPQFTWESGAWNTEWKKQWYVQAATDAGAAIWFGALNVATAIDGKSVCGVLVATPHGLGLLRAKAVVDATGNADVAAAAGASVVNISKAHVAVQGTGLSPFQPGRHYANTDYTFVDDTDIMDVTRAFAIARRKFHNAFDLAQLVDSRQRQQVEGELTLDPLDFLAGRTFPDTVVTAESNFDSHGFTIHPVFMAKPPDKEPIRAHVPFRSLLPRGLDGVLVTGLGVSAHRDALPVIRMQPDVQNQGYAAGRAAAMAATSGSPLRAIDMGKLQRHLVDVGILAPEVPAHRDSFPLDPSAIEDAVRNGIDDHLGLAVIFAHPERSLPLLERAYHDAKDDARLRYAHVLGLLGSDTGVDALCRHLAQHEWDDGWDYKGMGQFGFSLSSIDSMLIALGRSGNPRALPVMLDKLRQVAADAAFSHFRALTLAFEAQPCADAAPFFAALLEQHAGNSRSDVYAGIKHAPQSGTDVSERNRELRELLLARGLFACGDKDGKASAVLQAYALDYHGHYARHARAVLANRTL